MILSGEQGSTIPLISGFFLIALLFCAAAVMASDAFTRQRDLQSVCDGAATAAANSVDFAAARRQLSTDLPLGDVQGGVDSYLARDPQRAAVSATAALAPDGRTVTVSCARRTTLAFAGLFGAGGGITQRTSATARSPLD